MTGVNKILIGVSIGFKSRVYPAHIYGVVAVVIIARGILSNGSKLHRSKAESLDIVKLFDKTLKVAAPCRIGIGIVCHTVIPAVNIVA